MALALVTGAAGNLGRIVVNVMQDAGWTVQGVDRETDLGDAVQTRRRFDDIGRGCKAVIHLVGGIVAGKPIEQTSPEDMQSMLSLNTVTTFNVMRATIPLMQDSGGGSFIAIGAQAVLHPVSNRAAYASSKAAVVSLVQSMAEEGRQKSIRANCILPSIIRTPANLEWAEGDMDKDWITPEEIARTIVHLSDPGCGVSGAVIPMYGRLPY